jgi:5-deoxy-5-amino-3-dehydroquinate synthase
VITVPVPLDDHPYEVRIGAGARHLLAQVVPAHAELAAVVTQPGIGVDVDPALPWARFDLPPGEQAKTMSSVERLCRGFSGAGLSRRDVVVAVGGGVVSDVAGFAAATYLRGVAYVNVPTTLLAQVDAAVGGKTGVNLPEGKNLVGAFWQPAAVLCDTEALASLPPREWASGYGEVAKYAFLAPRPAEPAPGAALTEWSLDDQVSWCVGLKAAIVAEDEREGGRRMLLNYGHTLAHALEAVGLGGGPVRLRHGEAVAVGLVFAAELARRLGRIDAERVAEHRRVVAHFGLPDTVPPGVAAAELVAFMGRDKKASHDLTFVLDGPKGVEAVHGVDGADVVATLKAMGCRS